MLIKLFLNNGVKVGHFDLHLFPLNLLIFDFNVNEDWDVLMFQCKTVAAEQGLLFSIWALIILT